MLPDFGGLQTCTSRFFSSHLASAVDTRGHSLFQDYTQLSEMSLLRLSAPCLLLVTPNDALLRLLFEKLPVGLAERQRKRPRCQTYRRVSI